MIWCVALMVAATAEPVPPTTVRQAVRLLIREAGLVKTEGTDLPETPDLARRAPGLDPDDVVEALLRRAHEDPFVDGYVRWQLTSFDLELAGFDDRQFEQLLRHAPVLIPNPRAEPGAVTLFRRGHEAGPLPRRDLERLRSLDRALTASTARVESQNRAALAFYDQIQRKLPATGPRPRLWLLKRCAVMVAAGWPTRSVKRSITDSFSETVSDDTLTNADRRRLTAAAQSLAGRKRAIVTRMSVMANGSVTASFATSGISAKDVAGWIERLIKA